MQSIRVDGGPISWRVVLLVKDTEKTTRIEHHEASKRNDFWEMTLKLAHC